MITFIQNFLIVTRTLGALFYYQHLLKWNVYIPGYFLICCSFMNPVFVLSVTIYDYDKEPYSVVDECANVCII